MTTPEIITRTIIIVQHSLKHLVNLLHRLFQLYSKVHQLLQRIYQLMQSTHIDYLALHCDFTNFVHHRRLVLEEVTRLLNLEKQLPSYKYSVTVSCLKVLRKLQKCGHLPSNPKIYRSYAAYGQYIDVRIAAMECLVDFVKVDGRWEDLQQLMDLLETDPDPMIRHALARLLIDNPPFERGYRHKLDREELVERIWSSMK